MGISEHSKEELERQLKQLRGKEGQLEGDLYAVRDRIVSVKATLAEMQSPHKIGDIVQEKGGPRWQVTRFDKYWTFGRKLKKDGKPGSVEYRMYGFPESYTKVEG